MARHRRRSLGCRHVVGGHPAAAPILDQVPTSVGACVGRATGPPSFLISLDDVDVAPLLASCNLTPLLPAQLLAFWVPHKEAIVTAKVPTQTPISVVLGASVLMVVSADAAAVVAQSDAHSAVTAIRQIAGSGAAKIGQARLDEQGRLRLAQFNDTWNKWSKEFSDSKPS